MFSEGFFKQPTRLGRKVPFPSLLVWSSFPRCSIRPGPTINTGSFLAVCEFVSELSHSCRLVWSGGFFKRFALLVCCEAHILFCPFVGTHVPLGNGRSMQVSNRGPGGSGVRTSDSGLGGRIIGLSGSGRPSMDSGTEYLNLI